MKVLTVINLVGIVLTLIIITGLMDEDKRLKEENRYLKQQVENLEEIVEYESQNTENIISDLDEQIDRVCEYSLGCVNE